MAHTLRSCGEAEVLSVEDARSKEYVYKATQRASSIRLILGVLLLNTTMYNDNDRDLLVQLCCRQCFIDKVACKFEKNK